MQTFEQILLNSEVSELYAAIKEYSIRTLNIPVAEAKTYVGFGKYTDFYMFFIGFRNDKLTFSSRIEYIKANNESNIIRLSLIEENRDKIFECIDNIHNDYLQRVNGEKTESESYTQNLHDSYKQIGRLDVLLATPIEDIVPQIIAFNNVALMETVNEYLKKYEDRKYDESALGIAKTDRKNLNSLSRKLNSERLRIAKIYKAPYERFKDQVDEVIDRIKIVSGKIDVQIKEYEKEARKLKLEKIKEFFNNVFEEFAKLISYESIHNEKWLDPSAKMTDIFAEIKSIFNRIKSDIVRIESFDSKDEDLIKNYYFRTLDIDKALAEAEKHKEARRAIEELKRAQNIVVKNNVSQDNISLQPVVRFAENLQTAVLTVEGTGEQLVALINFLSASGIRFEITENGCV